MSLNTAKFPLIFVWGLLLIISSVRMYFYKPVVIPKNSQVELETIVRKVSWGENSQRIEVADIVVFAPLYPQINVGDRLRIKGKVGADGVILKSEIEILGHKESLPSYLWKFRQEITSRVETILPSREAALVVGTVLGVDKIGRDFKDELTKTGTIHVVVVSGQNLAIVAGIILSFVKYLGRRMAMIIAVLACVFYALLTGFEAPVVRALLMVISSTVALYFGRANSALISLLFAALLIIFVWPQSLESISFQLTFAATLGIITLGAMLQTIIKIPVIGEVTSVCLGAFVFTAPVILYHFGQISLLSPLVNILVSEAVFPIMVLGFFVCLASVVWLPVAKVISFLVFVPAKYFVEVVSFFAKFNIGTVNGFSGDLYVPFLFFALGVGLYLIWNKRFFNEQPI